MHRTVISGLGIERGYPSRMISLARQTTQPFGHISPMPFGHHFTNSVEWIQRFATTFKEGRLVVPWFRIARISHLAAAVCLLLLAPRGQAQLLQSDALSRPPVEAERQLGTTQPFTLLPPVSESGSNLGYELPSQTSAQPQVLGPSQTLSSPQTSDRFQSPNDFSKGWVSGAELLFLKPMASNGNVPGATYRAIPSVDHPGTMQVVTSNPYGFDWALRAWLGYVGENGVGVRFRDWLFDHDAQSTRTVHYYWGFTDRPVFGNLMCQTYDLEATKQVNFAAGRATFFAGTRFGHVWQGQSCSGVVDTLNVNALGLTSGADTYRTLFGRDDFGWVTNFRGSLLFGKRKATETVYYVNGLSDSTTIDAHGLLGIIELTTGPQWQRRRSRGGYFFLRAMCESQLWLDAGTLNFYSDAAANASDSLGFIGFSLAMGVVR